MKQNTPFDGVDWVAHLPRASPQSSVPRSACPICYPISPLVFIKSGGIGSCGSWGPVPSVVNGIMRTRNRPKITWIDVNKKDMIKWSVMRKKMACKKTYWKKRIHVGDPNLWMECLLLLL